MVPSSVLSAARHVARGLSSHRSIALAALAAILAAPAAQSQTVDANLRGYVRSAGGAPIENAMVATRSLATNQTRGTTTSSSGYYYLGGLRPGEYEVTMRHLGFTPQTLRIRLLIGQTRDLDFTAIESAAQLSGVQVTAAAGTDARTSEVGTNVTREQIDNLPSAERNFLDIARLAPGITATPVNSSDKFLAAGGQPAEAVNVFVDGVSYKNDVLRGGVVGQDASRGNPFPQGAVQEFRVLTQNYKAEYQKASSAIISATTRSGTNQWQGDAFVYGIPKGLVARDAFTARTAGPSPNYTRFQAGGSIGGPIRPDKLFIFANYELNARDEPRTVVVGPNAALAPPGLNPQQYAGRFISQFREHTGFGKLTWVQSERSSADGMFTIRRETDFRGFGGQTSYQAAENLAINVMSGGAQWKYAGDRWLNEAQVNLQRFRWHPQSINPNLIAKDYGGIIRIGGKEASQDWVQDRLTLRNDVTRAAIHALGGDHAVKMGASVDLLGYAATKNFFFSAPLYRFRSNESYLKPFNATFGFGDPKVTTNNTQFGVYVQDDWNVTRKLVLNLGIRWDGETNMINNSYVTPQPLADSLRLYENALVVTQPTPTGTRTVPIMRELGGLNRYITRGRGDRPMYMKAFQPRVGASYDIMGDESTVLFGGFGVYYDRNYWNTLFDERFRRQYRILNIDFSDTCAPGQFACVPWQDKYYDPAQLRTLGYATAPEVFLVANDMRPPKTNQFSAGVRHAFSAARVTLSYNGIRGYSGMNYVRVSPWGGPETTTPRNYSTVFAADDRVRTWYDAMQLQIERPVTAGRRWGGGIAYTLSKSTEQGQSTDIFWGFDDRYPTVADRPRLRAPGDQRHAIVANGIVRLPAQFMVSGIVSLGSGIAVNATDASAGWGPFQQRPYVFSPPTKPFLGLGHVFAFQNADLRLERGVTLRTGERLGIVADVFNAFNTANWGCYESTIIPTADQAKDTNWQRRFGQPFCAALGRRLQLGLKYGAD